MKYAWSLSLIALIISGDLFAADFASEYRLAAGDEIQIKVYGEEDLSLLVRLDESGVITYPYLGNLQAKNRSVAELKNIIQKGLLEDILKKPSVNVSIVQYRNFYIAGEVKQSGGFPFQPGITVRQAIALAGGLTEFGSTKRIQILHENSQEPVQATQDSAIRPGDTITVLEGMF